MASRKLELGEFKADQELAPGITVKKFIRDCACQPVFVGTEKSKKKDDKRRFRFSTAHLPPEDVVNAFLAEHAPPVLDPFAGGGSIPLEAQRLGLRAFASDLNPVPVLINKALIEIPPKFAGKPPVNPESRKAVKGRKKKELLDTHEWKGASGLAEDVRYYGKWMRDEAEKRIGHLYPKVKVTAEMAKDRPDLKDYVGEELTVIAWLWARTVASPNPAVGGAHVPLVRSYWLSTKKGKDAWVEPVIDPKKNDYRFEVRVGKPSDADAVDAGTKIGRGCKFKCLLSGQPIDDTHIKQAGMDDKLGARLLAIVAEGARSRVYLSPDADHEAIARLPRPANITAIEAPLANDPRNLWCLGYGLDRFDKLFTPRQLTALVTFSDLVGEARAKVLADAKAAGTLPADDRSLDQGGTGPQAYADAVATYLGMLVSRLSNYSSTICVWSSHKKDELVKQVFMRQAIPMTWDYGEANPFATSGGTWNSQVSFLTQSINAAGPLPANVSQVDATAVSNATSRYVVSTDPPYYDNIGYADLSDYFYIWLRKSLSSVFPQLFATVLTPKSQELIASPYRHDGSRVAAQTHFETGFGKTFRSIHDWQDAAGPMTVFYAFKQQEEVDDDIESATSVSTGWETMLEGAVRAGFTICGTWPVRTELVSNLKANFSNLASSIVLSCRPRPDNAPLATRREFLNSLKRELPEALIHLQQGSIAPVDLAQAAIGPGMAVFTRYSKVMEADGSPMTVRTALGLINQSLDEVLAEQEGEFDADTRWALAWFEQFGMEEGPFGVAETLSKAKNTAVNRLVEAGILHARGGKVRLLKRDELPTNWNPATDTRLRHWEVVQHLIRILETEGETAAADLLRQLGGLGEFARDLAYRLYNICERQKWASEALAYNGLVIAWPELTKLALAQRNASGEKQQTMFAE